MLFLKQNQFILFTENMSSVTRFLFIKRYNAVNLNGVVPK